MAALLGEDRVATGIATVFEYRHVTLAVGIQLQVEVLRHRRQHAERRQRSVSPGLPRLLSFGAIDGRSEPQRLQPLRAMSSSFRTASVFT